MSNFVEGINENDSKIHALIGGVIVTPEKEFEGSIVIRDGLIGNIGSEIEIPEDARIWNIKGKRIYPGFIESWKEFKLSENYSLSHWNKNIMPDRKVSSYLDLQSIEYEELRGLGFLRSSCRSDNGIFRGESSLIILREGEQGEQILNSNTAQILDFDHGSGGYPSSLMGSLALVRQVLSDAKWYQGVEVKYQTEEPSVKRATYNKALKSVDLKSNFYSNSKR